MIELIDFSIGYEDSCLICGANNTIEKCKLTALIGRNGTGKSTLLRAIAGLNKHYSGQIELSGHSLKDINVSQLAKTLSFVTTERIRIPNMRCKDVVATGRSPYTNWIGNMQDTDWNIVMKSLEQVGMKSYAERTMDKMSDGECQRIMIARALAQSTPIILLDEPTSFLDISNRYELCSLLSKLAHYEEKCILFSTHELDIALSIADNIAFIDQKKLLYMSATEFYQNGYVEHIFHNSCGSIFYNMYNAKK